MYRLWAKRRHVETLGFYRAYGQLVDMTIYDEEIVQLYGWFSPHLASSSYSDIFPIPTYLPDTRYIIANFYVVIVCDILVMSQRTGQ